MNNAPIEVAEVETDEETIDLAVVSPRSRRVRSQPCQAKRTDGSPCGRWSILGGYTCPAHGSSAPQAKDAARRRLQALLPLGIAVLGELADGYAVDPETGQPIHVPPAVRARAAAELVRLSGVGAPAELNLTAQAVERPDLDDRIAQALAARELSQETLG